MPAFVYMIPIIAFFGAGKPRAVVTCLIFGHTARDPADRTGASRRARVHTGGGDCLRRFELVPDDEVDLPLAAPSNPRGE